MLLEIVSWITQDYSSLKISALPPTTHPGIRHSKLESRRNFSPWVVEGRKEGYLGWFCNIINSFTSINTKSSAKACGKFQLCFPSIEGKTHKEGWVGTQAHQLALLVNITDDQFKNRETCGRCLLPEYAQARQWKKNQAVPPSAGVGWESRGSSWDWGTHKLYPTTLCHEKVDILTLGWKDVGVYNETTGASARCVPITAQCSHPYIKVNQPLSRLYKSN